ncbi:MULTISPECIES: hypothetical protein [unclassified Flavobacterium]|uniref:hypothetical protein n=1 Tax=unclassified Flavobacterium TaxID=196869 RepID=UPI0006ABAA26|nr:MULTISPECIES: hypothetical protein [unclassified Flavobacterium]KOP38237.1 hypothetical protein AKO67_10400 [Flavobacterium sp. VMW]OWU92265.1 hypothetical protein APR43_03240 [Flavobacterium sp. NLM]
MNDFFNKLSSYNLFNNLLPGILFVVLINHFTNYKISHDNLLINVFLYYFIGLTISRISSVYIEPFLKKIKFVTFRDYKLFVDASKKDNKLEILLEVNNKFRVLLTTIILVILSKVYYSIDLKWFNFSENTQEYLLLIFIAIIYLFAYRKQTNYVIKRIDANT